MGSLLKIHFTDRPVRDYRSAQITPAEAARQAAFNHALLNEGVFMAGYGLMALSTPMTDDDVSAVVHAASAALTAIG
jgi:glutamate-1-semialdehyde 2,1-aminomutase